jgi:hypothetical protein
MHIRVKLAVWILFVIMLTISNCNYGLCQVTMSYCPLQILNKPDHSWHVVFTYDSAMKAEGLLPVEWFISQWRAVGKLYGPVLELAAYLDGKLCI